MDQIGCDTDVIIRGSKVFYSCASDPRFRLRSHVNSTADVARIIEGFGFQTIFAQRENNQELTEVDLLHDLLHDDQHYE